MQPLLPVRWPRGADTGGHMYAEQASSVNLLVVQNMDGLNHDHAGSSYWIPLKMHGVHPS
jgi:hypothetical protein